MSEQLPPEAIAKVALVGATGHLGPAILSALEGDFSVTVIQRESSKARLPPTSNAKIVRIPDNFERSALISAFTGQDAVVVAMPGNLADQHITLAEAAAAAGVRRFIPPDFGSVDSADQVVAEILPLYRAKTSVRERCQELSRENKSFTWTSIVGGHFFDWGLEEGLLGFDLKKKQGVIFDDGETKWSASTLRRLGEAVVSVLKSPSKTEDKIIYVQSFCTSQAELLETLMGAGGSIDVTFEKSQEYIDDRKDKVKDGRDHHATEEMVAVLGMTRANWTAKRDFMNEELGLKDEDLLSVVKEVVQRSVKGSIRLE